MTFKNLELFASHFQALEDNHEYCDHLKLINQQHYLIVYSYISPIKEIIAELEGRMIPYSHYDCPFSGETYVLVDERYLF